MDKVHRAIGPLAPDRLCVLVGSTGKGKSAFAVQVAESAARAGHPVLYASAEMSADELVARLLCLRAWSPTGGRPPQYSNAMRGAYARTRVVGALDELKADCPNLYVWAPRGNERNADALQRAAIAVTRWSALAIGEVELARDSSTLGSVERHETLRPPLVVVDYVQRFARADSDNIRGAMRDMSGDLRDLSRPGGLGPGWTGAAVLALSSTARDNYRYFASVRSLRWAFRGRKEEVDDNGKVTKKRVYPVSLEGMGKESGELEYDASVLLCLTSDDPDDDAAKKRDPREALLVVAKQRHGAKGLVDMTFHPASGVFTEGKSG